MVTVTKWALLSIVLVLFFLRGQGRQINPITTLKRAGTRVCGPNLADLIKFVCKNHIIKSGKRDGSDTVKCEF